MLDTKTHTFKHIAVACLDSVIQSDPDGGEGHLPLEAGDQAVVEGTHTFLPADGGHRVEEAAVLGGCSRCQGSGGGVGGGGKGRASYGLSGGCGGSCQYTLTLYLQSYNTHIQNLAQQSAPVTQPSH